MLSSAATKSSRQGKSTGSPPPDSQHQKHQSSRWNLNRLFTPKGILLLLPDDSVKIYSEPVTVAQVQQEFPNCHVGSATTMRCQLAPEKVLHHGSTYYLSKKLTWNPQDDDGADVGTAADESEDDVSRGTGGKARLARHARASRSMHWGTRSPLEAEAESDLTAGGRSTADDGPKLSSNLDSLAEEGARTEGRRSRPRAPSAPRRGSEARLVRTMTQMSEEGSEEASLRRFRSGRFQRSEAEERSGLTRIQRQPTSTAFDICRQLEKDKGVTPWSSLPISSGPALRRLWSGRFQERSLDDGAVAVERAGRFADSEAEAQEDKAADVSKTGAQEQGAGNRDSSLATAVPQRFGSPSGKLPLEAFQEETVEECPCCNAKVTRTARALAFSADSAAGKPSPAADAQPNPTHAQSTGPRSFAFQAERNLHVSVTGQSRSASNSPADRAAIMRYGALDAFSPQQDVRVAVARALSSKEREMPRGGIPNVCPLRTSSSCSEQMQSEMSPSTFSPTLSRGLVDPYSPAFSGRLITSSPSAGGYSSSPGSSPSFSPGHFSPSESGLACFTPSPRTKDPSFGMPESPSFGPHYGYVGPTLHREPRPSSRFRTSRFDGE